MTINEILTVASGRAYTAARAEYDALPPTEKTGDAFRDSVRVHMETYLAHDTGRLIASHVADSLADSFEASHEPDIDNIVKDQQL